MAQKLFLVAIRDVYGALQAYSREAVFTASDKVQETARNSKIIQNMTEDSRFKKREIQLTR